MSTSLTSLARTVHLIDVENLAGTGRLTDAHIRDCRSAYLRAMHVGRNDHVIIGVSHCNNAFAVAHAWPGARILLRSGPDGADEALQMVMESEALERRFARCVLATGDGGFAYAVAALTRRGLSVHIACQAGSVSSKLRLAGATVQQIDFTDTVRSRSAG
ncbi:PIN domain-containing protein [Jatrophihabitans fulvus]